MEVCFVVGRVKGCPTLFHFNHTVGNLADKVSIVAGENHSAPIFLQRRCEGLDRFHIEMIARLIENQYVVGRKEQSSQTDACPLSAAEYANLFSDGGAAKQKTARDIEQGLRARFWPTAGIEII